MIDYFERAFRQKLIQFHRVTERSVQGVALELEEIFTDTSANGQQKLERHVFFLLRGSTDLQHRREIGPQEKQDGLNSDSSLDQDDNLDVFARVRLRGHASTSSFHLATLSRPKVV